MQKEHKLAAILLYLIIKCFKILFSILTDFSSFQQSHSHLGIYSCLPQYSWAPVLHTQSPNSFLAINAEMFLSAKRIRHVAPLRKLRGQK